MEPSKAQFTDNATPPSPDVLAEYRAALDALMAQCLKSIRAFDLPAEAEPLQTWKPDD